jgi:hypothetical protein
MTEPPPPGQPDDAARFRATLVRVMLVQVVALVVLWLVQRRFSI